MGVPLLEGSVPLSVVISACGSEFQHAVRHKMCAVTMQAHLRDPIRTRIVVSSSPVRIFLGESQEMDLSADSRTVTVEQDVSHGTDVAPVVLSLGCLASGYNPVDSAVVRWFDPLCATLSEPTLQEIPGQWLPQLVSDVFVAERLLGASVVERGVDPLKSDTVLLLKDKMARNDSWTTTERASPEIFSLSLRQDGLPHWSAVTAAKLQTLSGASMSGISLHWTLFMSNNASFLFEECARLLRPGGLLRVVEVGTVAVVSLPLRPTQ
jgi:hypothetical protein